MSKLTKAEVREIARRLHAGNISVYGLSRIYGVTPQWIREIRTRSDLGLPLPGEVPLGRPRKERPPEEAELILAAEIQHGQHPVGLEKLLARDYGIFIPHNRIWEVLKSVDMVKNSPKKQERRKWVRFQRRFSNSLWQMDYTQLGQRDWLLAIIDDASRLIVGYSRVKSPTAQVAWDTFVAAGERYGFPRQILTDNGTQFIKLGIGGLSFFDKQLRRLNKTRQLKIQHIHSRVHHPQTGGKIERLFGTIKSKLHARWPWGEQQFDTLDEIIVWYNTDKPHLSLNFEIGETPMMAFVRKLRPSERKAYLSRHPEDKR